MDHYHRHSYYYDYDGGLSLAYLYVLMIFLFAATLFACMGGCQPCCGYPCYPYYPPQEEQRRTVVRYELARQNPPAGP